MRRHPSFEQTIAAALMTLGTASAAEPAPAARVNTQDPAVQSQARALAQLPPVTPPHGRHIPEDPSGRLQVGQASIYGSLFQGHQMANGERFHHTGSAAASRTLPLGTQARVTNLHTGQTALVTVEDRGPFVDGRTMDVSRATASQIGLTRKDGVAPVEVAPVAVPQRDGTVRAGAGAVK